MKKLLKSLEDTPPDAKEAKLILESMRWKADCHVINDFSEHVWLKALYVDENYSHVDPDSPGARRIGITDCCMYDSPCERHSSQP